MARLHLITLMGFRNRLNVFVNWVWNYVTYDRSVRLIFEPSRETCSVAELDAAATATGRI